MSVVFDSSSMLGSGVVFSQYRGFGVPVEEIPATGDTTPAFAYGWIQAGDAGKEFRWELSGAAPSGVTLHEDSSYESAGLSSNVSFGVNAYLDNALVSGSPVTVTLNIGGAVLAGAATGSGTGAGNLSVPPDQLQGGGTGGGVGAGDLTVPGQGAGLGGAATGSGIGAADLTAGGPGAVLQGGATGGGQGAGTITLPGASLQGAAAGQGAGAANLTGGSLPLDGAGAGTGTGTGNLLPGDLSDEADALTTPPVGFVFNRLNRKRLH